MSVAPTFPDMSNKNAEGTKQQTRFATKLFHEYWMNMKSYQTTAAADVLPESALDHLLAGKL